MTFRIFAQRQFRKLPDTENSLRPFPTARADAFLQEFAHRRIQIHALVSYSQLVQRNNWFSDSVL